MGVAVMDPAVVPVGVAQMPVYGWTKADVARLKRVRQYEGDDWKPPATVTVKELNAVVPVSATTIWTRATLDPCLIDTSETLTAGPLTAPEYVAVAEYTSADPPVATPISMKTSRYVDTAGLLLGSNLDLVSVGVDKKERLP